MRGSPDGKSFLQRFSQRHADGLRNVVGFIFCTFGVVATCKAFQDESRERGRLALFIYLMLALIAFFAVLYRFIRTKVKVKRAWQAALIASCSPLVLAWRIPSRYGPPLIDSTGTMAHRIPGYILPIMWGLVLMWPPLSLTSRRQARS